MNKKILIITGGTGGHVIPATNFANYLLDKKINCKILLDYRGLKYVDKFDGEIFSVRSSNLSGSLFSKFIGTINLIIGFVQSFFLILHFKPNTVISFGSYASFFPMMICVLLKSYLKIEIFLHEQNTIIGRTNSFFLKYTNKIFLNFNIKSKIKKNFINKTYIVGSPEKKFIKSNDKTKKDLKKKFTIFIFGGSQGSEYLTIFSLKLIKLIIREKIIDANFIIQYPKKIDSKSYEDLKKLPGNVIIRHYFKDIEKILENTSIAISRAGAGSINNLINFEIPSILVPLPSSKDNHQFYNASIISESQTGIIIDQSKNEIKKAKDYIYKIYKNYDVTKLIKKKFNKIKVKNSNSLIYKLLNNED